MRGGRRRAALASLIAMCALAFAMVLALGQPVAAKAKCHPQPFCEQPTPAPTPPPDSGTPAGSARPSFPVAGSVQAITAPTPPLTDDTRATPGPLVGTMVTPQGVLVEPVSAPAIAGHPQQQTGLEVLLVVAGVLAFFTLAALTLAFVVR